jgi:hypothetical protein
LTAVAIACDPAQLAMDGKLNTPFVLKKLAQEVVVAQLNTSVDVKKLVQLA